jgi:vancomycin resistance protein YoaR
MSSRPRPRPRRRQPFLVALGLLATLALGVAAVGLGLRVAYEGQALPGTRVAGVALGGASAAEARRRLRPVAGSDVPVILRAAGRTYRISPELAGYAVDLDATVDSALEAGRDGAAGGVVATVRGIVRPREVALVVGVDRERFARTVAGLADEIDREAFPGALRITTEPVTVVPEAPRTGRRVDRRQLARLLEGGIRRRGGPSVTVPVTSTPVASRDAVAAVAREAEAFLEEPLRLTGAGAPVVVGAEQLAGVVALETLDGGRRVRLGAGDKRLAALVDDLAATRERPARDARISATNPGVTLEAKGDVRWRPRRAEVTVRPGRSGLELRRAETAAAIEAAIRAGRHQAPLRVRRVRPAVSRASAERVDSLIGTFTTRYAPGQPRVTNIRRIARAVDGTVVAPGAQFSLNAAAGERTAAKGYVEAPFIAEGNRLEDSVGGGVSQFSTTLYNAAYFAGLRIDAHTPHSFYIDRYPAGRESTLNFGSIDLLWTNDTKAPVLVRTATGATSVTVSLYGNNGGRRVQALTGARQPRTGGGFSMVVTRKVTFRDGRTASERFTTTYGVPAEE